MDSIRSAVVVDRAEWVRRMLHRIGELPLTSLDEFRADPRNVAAAESYLRRALEALLDLGRHILAKGFGEYVSSYKDIAVKLGEVGVLPGPEAAIARQLAGYRNRLVHFYHEIGEEELFEICSSKVEDVEKVLNGMLDWLRTNRDKVDWGK